MLDCQNFGNLRKLAESLKKMKNEAYRNIGDVVPVGITSITENGITTIPPEVAEILKVKDNDEISWLLNNKNVRITKSTKELKLAMIGKSNVKFRYRNIQWSVYIPSSVREIIHPMDDKILWLLDDDNIIVRNIVLQGDCSKHIIDKEIISIITNMTLVSKKGQTTIPRDIVDIIGIDNSDTIYINTDDISISNKSSKSTRPIKIYWVIPRHAIIYLGADILTRLNVSIGDKLLWIFDEYENIYIRNNLLICY